MAKLYLNLPARLLCTTYVLVCVQTCYAARCWDRRTIRVDKKCRVYTTYVHAQLCIIFYIDLRVNMLCC